MNMMINRAGAVAVAALVATFSLTPPASAEGSWSSSISNWLNGNESRRWTDNHNDSASTTVSFSGCNFGGPSSATLELDHVRDFLPDVSHGTRSNTCNTVSWGEVGAAEFYFIYIGSARLNVSSVVTRY
ncbi:hypothetical protein [Streptomyces sudanensis]|uniref:hypothetical protein n=1 Tax=Streptomyces sudanensis TaxID=436397 RepID=UPI0020CF27F5|nr:hypothetical protein [Streptomyces sudanensis]MCP9956796.1 hypothetical protein [Streptomyces sudanensis]MCQ0002615.1 hypothetical protein [Streptomyces sudanensis]